MSEQLTRWEYTRKKLGLSWVERLVGAVAAVAIGVYLKQVGPGLAAGLGVIVVSTLAKGCWHFLRARIVQEREDRDALKGRLAGIEAAMPILEVEQEGENLLVTNEGGVAKVCTPN
jgi:hypothetical protein